jgi:hypothetical protein
LGGDVAVNSGSTAQVIEKDQKAGAAMFNVIDNLLLPPDELASVSGHSCWCFTWWQHQHNSGGSSIAAAAATAGTYVTRFSSLDAIVARGVEQCSSSSSSSESKTLQQTQLRH